jgi:hypothetical protein
MAGTPLAPSAEKERQRDTRAWHPKLRALHVYWLSLWRGDLFPARQRLDPLAIPQLLDSLFLIDIERQPLRFRYRLMGTKLVAFRGRELKGLYMEEAHPEFETSPVKQHYVILAETGEPRWRKGLAQFDWGGRPSIERLLLPLADDGRTPDCILGMSVFGTEEC